MNTRLQAPPSTIATAFRSLITLEDVANLLEVPQKHLIYYIYRLKPEKKYTSFSIKKRNGTSRELAEPVSGLKIIQQILLSVLTLIYKPRPSVHGFVLGRSIATNAQLHEGQRFVLNIDLEGFFPSINFGRIRGMFMAEPYNISEKASTVLAQICCLNGKLPQGAPTSPIISNMICYKLDGELQRLASRRRCIYSRYADDITFSTMAAKFPKALAFSEGSSGPKSLVIGNELRTIIEENGFSINHEKTRLFQLCFTH